MLPLLGRCGIWARRRRSEVWTFRSYLAITPIYKTEDGDCPYTVWLEALRDKRARQRIGARIRRVESGNFGDSKAVGEGVIEVRVDYGPGYRVYFGRDGNQLVILLIGGDKRTQAKDIAAAKVYWADYKTRKTEKQDDTHS